MTDMEIITSKIKYLIDSQVNSKIWAEKSVRDCLRSLVCEIEAAHHDAVESLKVCKSVGADQSALIVEGNLLVLNTLIQFIKDYGIREVLND